LKFVEFPKTKCNEGILAEVWGIAPMTHATAAMLQPPKAGDQPVDVAKYQLA